MDSYTAIDLMRAKFKENWNTPVFKVSGDAISLMATTYQYSPEYNPEGFPVSAFGVDGCFPNQESNQFNFELLASGSKDFSGAEIEQVIYDAMQFGFSQNREFTTEDILDSIADCIPLAKIASHQIEALKDWASRSGAKSASLSICYRF